MTGARSRTEACAGAGGDNGFKGTAAAMKALGSDTAWTIVGKDKLYLPTEMDVGHRLKLVVQVRPQCTLDADAE